MARILFTNVRVFDGTGDPTFAGEVLIQGNHVAAVGRRGKPLERGGAELVDGGGATIMPGLVEAHAHLSWPSAVDRIINAMKLEPEEHLLITARTARITLDHGFTSAYSAGSLGARFEIALRNEINGGWLPGPRLKASSIERAPARSFGLPESHDEGHGRGPEAMRKYIRSCAELGIDSVKLLLSGDDNFTPGGSQDLCYSEEEVAAAGEEARACGLWLACHAQAAAAVKLGVRHGFRVLYHCSYADDEALDMLEAKKDEIFVAPAVGLADLGDPCRAEHGHAASRHRARQEDPRAPDPPRARAAAARRAGAAGRRLRLPAQPHRPQRARPRAVRAAVRLQPGRGADGGHQMGRRDHGHERRPGARGFLADLLMVNGDPTEDVRILQDRDNLLMIMKDGAYHKAPRAADVRRIAAE